CHALLSAFITCCKEYNFRFRFSLLLYKSFQFIFYPLIFCVTFSFYCSTVYL
ncbi:hypothetical protein C0J52_27643, partial [Blattella germanica]